MSKAKEWAAWGCVRIQSWRVCLSLQALQSVGVSLLQQRASLRHIISTYHSDRPAREDTGTHNPHSGSASCTLYHSTLICFSIVFLWLRTCQELQSQQSAHFYSELLQLQQRGFEASRATSRPRKSQFSNCRVCFKSAPNSTMWYVEGSWENKEINFGNCNGILGLKTKTLARGAQTKIEKRTRDCWVQ